MSYMQISVISRMSLLAGGLALVSPFIWHCKVFRFRHYVQTLQPDSFIVAMLIGAVDCYYFIPVTDLDLAWGLQGQQKTKLVCFIFLHTFQLNGMKFGVVMKEFKLNI